MQEESKGTRVLDCSATHMDQSLPHTAHPYFTALQVSNLHEKHDISLLPTMLLVIGSPNQQYISITI